MTDATTRWGANAPTVHNPNGCTQLGKAVDYCWVCDCEHFVRVPLNDYKAIAKKQRKLDGTTRPRSARGLEEDAAWNAWRDALDAEEHGSWWSKEEEIAAAYEERYAVEKHHGDVGSNEDEAWALQYDYEETP